MPIAKRPMEHSINELPTDLQRCNFIIHEAYSNYEQTEYGYIALCDMSFKVSLIEKNGQIHHQYNHVTMQGRCVDIIITKNSNLKSVKKFVYDCTYNAPNSKSQWKARKNIDRNESCMPAISELDDESCIAMNDNGCNNYYSQSQSQTSFDAIVQSTAMNPYVIGNSSYDRFNYLNNFNLLNSAGGLNINITTNNRRNMNNEGRGDANLLHGYNFNHV